MKYRFTLPLSLVVLVLNCGPDRPPAETGKADSPGDVEDADGDEQQEDPENCGDMGLNCRAAFGIGSCIDGQCGPTASECYATWHGDCNTICALEGRPCAELGCEGATALIWYASQPEEAALLCSLGREETATFLQVACDEPLDDVDTYVACCCSW
jgi:hypothetical protein